MMTYVEAIEFIHGTYTFGIKLGLDNIGKLLEIMGDPQDTLKFVHIAGTNGKGSTSNMISSVLQNAGYKVGLYISPYLEEFTERIQINGVQIPKERLADTTWKVKKNIEKIMQLGYPHPSEFEVVTAIGIQYFYDEMVDIVVLEVGMGGRFDATNIIQKSEVSVITSVGLDHVQYLGNTLQQIAYEKAGIIKNNGNVVLSPQSSEVTQEILKVCEVNKASVYIPNIDCITSLETSLTGQSLHYQSAEFGAFDFTLRLLGEHQIINCLTAIAVLEILVKNHYQISISAIQAGMKQVNFPGRFELLQTAPTIIIDGAHNEAGIDALISTIQKYLKKKVKIVLGILADKDFSTMIQKLSTITDEIYTVTPNNPRAMNAVQLADFIKEKCPALSVYPLSSIEESVALAKNATITDTFIFAGSLYMIGEARTYLKRNK
ncbi:MAG: bifunctional folylpolyglutamate synthase/dihydrofolate synthase [Eubacteriales bacterium]